MKMNSASKKLAFSAVMAALCMVATYALAFPFPSGIGYFNVGDVVVLLAGWLLGPIYGGLAAGLGSMLADLFLGFASYMPATFVVKGCVAVVGWALYSVCKKLIKKEGLDFLPRAISGLVAELVMALGYFVFEALILGLGVGALASVTGNLLQGLCGCVGAVAVMSALYPLPAVRKLFPALCARNG